MYIRTYNVMCTYIYTCAFIYIYICMYVPIYIYVYTYIVGDCEESSEMQVQDKAELSERMVVDWASRPWPRAFPVGSLLEASP